MINKRKGKKTNTDEFTDDETFCLVCGTLFQYKLGKVNIFSNVDALIVFIKKQ